MGRARSATSVAVGLPAPDAAGQVDAADAVPVPVPVVSIPELHALRREKIVAEDDLLEPIATALRFKGFRINEIATALGVDHRRVQRVLKTARRDGRLSDVLSDLQHEALPLAIEKLIDALESGQQWAIQDTLKGLGAFRSYTQQAIDAHTESRSLEVTWTVPESPVEMTPGAIVGRPREVVDATLHARRLEGAEPAPLRESEPGGVGDVGSPGEDPRGELLPSPGTRGTEDPRP